MTIKLVLCLLVLAVGVNIAARGFIFAVEAVRPDLVTLPLRGFP